jgi:hypothetical protein
MRGGSQRSIWHRGTTFASAICLALRGGLIGLSAFEPKKTRRERLEELTSPATKVDTSCDRIILSGITF